jgi:hypothetical protein
VTSQESRVALRQLAESVPPGTAVTVSRDWLLLATDPVDLEPEEQLLTPAQAARRLGVTPAWFYRRPELPFRRKLSHRHLMISAAGLEEWMRLKSG